METVKLKAPNDITSFSHDGNEYSADKNGVFTVPADAASVAIADFGFTAAK